MQIASFNNLTISNTSRFWDLIGELLKPHLQTPSIVFFYGKKGGNKNIILRFLFPYNNTKRNQSGGIANIYIDNVTIYIKHPIFFTDGNINIIFLLK